MEEGERVEGLDEITVYSKHREQRGFGEEKEHGDVQVTVTSSTNCRCFCCCS